MRITLVLVLLIALAGCKNKHNYVFKYDDDKAATKFTTANIVFGQGFKNDKLVLTFATKKLLDSTVTTNPATGLATGVYPITKQPPYDSYFVELNDALLQIPMFNEYQNVVVSKQDNKIFIEYTNRDISSQYSVAGSQ